MPYSTLEISKMQKKIAPKVYGQLDLDIEPERFRRQVDSKPDGFLRAVKVENLEKFIQDPEELEFYRQLTLMGDPIADAFALRFKDLGYGPCRAMLDKALEEGIEAVKDAPPELVALIEDMERKPEWLDWEKIDRFNKRTRVMNAVTGEYVMRVAFMMTYLNGYQGLPMIMTGQLTGESAAGRMRETTSTFKMANLPGALRRDGEAFRSAAKVRVMHAMVRTNLLAHKERWDYEVYGVPIPQVDQMGAALGFNFLSSLMSVKTKRPLTKAQREGIDSSRYLAYLLGMHDFFLSDQRGEIIKSWSMLGATLRNQFDERSKKLNQATLEAYTRRGNSLFDKFMHELDVRNTRFIYTKFVGEEKAKQMGVQSSKLDALATGVLFGGLGLKVGFISSLKFLPGGVKRVDEWAVKEIKRQLRASGEAQYKTDAAQYKMG